MNLLLKKPYKKHYSMKDKINTNKINAKRSEHKQKLREVRVSRLEKQLKSNILKRKKASKKNNG